MTSLDDVNSTDEASVYLKLPRQKIMEMARTGQLEGIKAGRRWLFTREALLAYTQKRHFAPSVAAPAADTRGELSNPWGRSARSRRPRSA